MNLRRKLYSLVLLGTLLISASPSRPAPFQPLKQDLNKQALRNVQAELQQLPMGVISFADSVITYDPGNPGSGTGGEPDSAFQNPRLALGPPADTSDSFVSLGSGGTIVLNFIDNILEDGPGDDLMVFRPNSEDDLLIWISDDGLTYISVGRITSDKASLDIAPVANPERTYTYVKLRDDPDQGVAHDPALGADIDAVAAINTALYIEVPADTLFERETTEIRPEGRPVLSAIAAQIREHAPVTISIHVHTDSWGAAELNFLLSQQQAGAVRNYFWDMELRLDMEISAVGWGESRPAASNETEEGRFRNRRVAFFIRSMQDSMPPN